MVLVAQASDVREDASCASFAHFASELARLTMQFERNIAAYKEKEYSEARVRLDFLDPLFKSLGWDMENRAGWIPEYREVEIESRVNISGRKKRADYLFRISQKPAWVCEAKKPAETLSAKHAYQAKRYAWNNKLALSILTDFEELAVYVVGSRPRLHDDVRLGLWRKWSFEEYPAHAREIWDLLSHEAIQGGSINRLVASLPRRTTGRKQQWLYRPERKDEVDDDFLDFLDEARRALASDLLRQNDRADLLADNRLNEAVQRILDRLLFLRICEDRDIDTGRSLDVLLRQSEDDEAHTLWEQIARHCRNLDTPGHVPFFNGNLFKPHFCENLRLSNKWLTGFLRGIGDEESPYLFNTIPVEILGTIYERFLGKLVRPQGRGVSIEEKPEVRKAGGVYYTPRYIVDYIVEQTVGKLVEGKAPEASLGLRVLDPACGSGSFLIRAFEALCAYWQKDLTEKLRKLKTAQGRLNWLNKHEKLCWLDEVTNDLHLTVDLKRRILTSNIYGVDLDEAAVEVSQLSLYLKMLEGETRQTLERQRPLFSNKTALLPPLTDNIKCGNSLIASDFSLDPDDLVRVNAFDWPVQFKKIMEGGGFDAVIGNPPYGAMLTESDAKYFRENYKLQEYQIDTYITFLERSLALVKSDGLIGLIIPNTWLLNVQMPKIRHHLVEQTTIEEIVHFADPVFNQATVDTEIIVIQPTPPFVTHDVKVSFVRRDGSWEKFSTAQSRWRKFAGNVINILERPNIIELADRLRMFPKLAEFYKVTQGAKPFQVGKGKPKQTRAIVDSKPFVSDRKIDKTFKPLLRGSLINRYLIGWNNNSWISLGDWLAEPRYSASYDAPEKVVIRQTGDSLIATLDTSQFVVRDNLYTIIPLDGLSNLRFLLALLNSKLIGWFYQNVVNPEVGEALAQVKRAHLDSLPIPICDSNKNDNVRHIKLMGLADKMLSLVPKLRAVTSEKEKSTLQNAVDATDRQIDQLVYELYGLTEEEIQLVEQGR
jgi:adenine-specific DNA-methyltransferase